MGGIARKRRVLRLLVWLAFFAVASFAICNNDDEAPKEPLFHLTLTPSLDTDPYRLHGNILLSNPSGATNETLAMLLPTTIASVPSAQYGRDGLTAADDKGDLSLGFHEVDHGAFGLPYQIWTAQRATEGPVSIQFTAEPAWVNRSALPAPHFDIRNATGGLSGSMWALVPVPDPISTDEYNITVAWNLTSRQSAAYTWADGRGPHSHSFVGPLTRLIQTFFIVGDVKGYPSLPMTDVDNKNNNNINNKLGIYWLEKTPFDMDRVGTYLQTLFAYSNNFWQDTSTEPYRVFIRINEEERAGTVGPGAGGTALLRSFLFGYRRDVGLAQDKVTTLLAHEMTHNWTPWAGGTNAEQSRYNEGGAEFWSLRLLWRAGMLGTKTYLDEMNARAVGYFRNPAVHLTDEQAQRVAWEMRDAQRIPYGRGMLHFANIDARMRGATSSGTTQDQMMTKENGNKKKLDDLAIPFFHACQQDANCGSREWFYLLRSALGPDAVEEWNQVSLAQPLIRPVEGSLGPCFDVVINGTNPVVYVWRAKEGINISSVDCLI